MSEVKYSSDVPVTLVVSYDTRHNAQVAATHGESARVQSASVYM